ncbi:DUF1559 domain-containing protein [Planctomycetaceae bacterium SH139]
MMNAKAIIARRCRCLAWLGVVMFVGIARVQAQQPAANELTLPVGVVMTDTIAVVKLDLLAIEPETLGPLLSGMVGAAGADIERSVQMSLSTLSDAGAKYLYLTVPAGAIPHGAVCLVIPCEDVNAVGMFLQQFVATIPGPLEFVVLQQTGQVVVCPAVMRSKFEQVADSQQRVDRDDFSRGLQSLAKFPHQAVLSLPKELQATLGRVFPDKLSSDVSTDFSPSRWVENVNTLAIGWSLSPNVDLQIRMFSPDGASADVALAETMKLVKLAPGLETAVTAATDGSQVTLGIQPQALNSVLGTVMGAQRQAAQRMQASNNLKQISMAMHHYHDVYGHIVPAAIQGENGKPLLSWRVALLPYIGQQELYDQFKLDEPWDSEYNKSLLSRIPPVYADPLGGPLPPGMTTYRLPVIPGAIYSSAEPLRFKDIKDGLSNTIWLMRSPRSAAIEWTNPAAWELDSSNLRSSVFGDALMAIVGFGDGSVRTIEGTISEEMLGFALQYADGEPVKID